MIDEGIEVHVVLGEEGPMASRYRSVGAIIHRMPIDISAIVRPNPTFYLAAARQLRGLVAHLRPDIIHSHFLGTTIFARLALGRASDIPRIFQVPGPLHLEHTATRLLELHSAGFFDHYIATCEFTREVYLQHGTPAERVHLSYYGTDVEAYSPLGRNESGLKEIAAPEGAAIVGMVAYMYAPKRYLGQDRGLKGHEDLIEAIGQLLDKGRNIAAVFVGGAWGQAHRYESRLRLLGEARLGPNGIFLGTRSDVISLYRSFDLVAHPSHSENLGGAAESLLLGVPTVATRVGGFPDIVRHGETGLLVPPRSPKALADAIEAILDDPARAQAMANNGRKLTQGLLDVRKTGREISEIYQRVLAVQARPGAIGDKRSRH
jgi:glycosyltransferase involved in cell wall biosynthesis